jgi:hypothetical protein
MGNVTLLLEIPRGCCTGMKIVWGINVPYVGEKITWPGVEENRPCSGEAIKPLWVPCIRIHKEMSFELCDVCGEAVPYGRVSRRITTCCPKCNAKKWDVINGLVIEKERNANGVRPKSFWNTIRAGCFSRDNYTCQHCHKTDKELQVLQQTDAWLDPEYVKTKYGGYWRGTKRIPGYKYTDYNIECHHIISIKNGGNNQLENLITLCGKCHKIEHGRVANKARMHKPLSNYLEIPDS